MGSARDGAPPPKAWERAWLCVTVAFILYAPYAKIFTSAETRAEYLWKPSHAAALLASVLACGAVLFVLDSASRRFVPARWRILAVALAFLYFPALYHLSLTRTLLLAQPVRRLTWALIGPVSLLWLIRIERWLILGLVLAALFRHHERAAAWLRTGLLVFSPTVPVFFLGLFTYPTVPQRVDPPAAQAGAAASSAPSVVFVIFDEWSYARTFTPGALAELPAVRRLCATSFVFDAASSPGGMTGLSVPHLIGGQASPGAGRYRAGSIFSDAKAAGLPRYVVGWAMPYLLWFPDLDGAWLQSTGRRMEASFPRQALDMTAAAFAQGVGPAWAKGFFTRLVDPAGIHRQNLRAFQRHALEQVARARRPCLLYLHYPIPHPPFIGDARPDAGDAAAAGYMGNVRLADEQLGQLMSALKKSGLWDKSLVIVTADHSWREDAQNPDHLHVPLLVKLPGQSRRFEIRDRFETGRLRSLVRAVLDGKLTREGQLAGWARAARA